MVRIIEAEGHSMIRHCHRIDHRIDHRISPFRTHSQLGVGGQISMTDGAVYFVPKTEPLYVLLVEGRGIQIFASLGVRDRFGPSHAKLRN